MNKIALVTLWTGCLSLGLLFAGLANGEVLKSGETGFYLKISISVPATPAQAFHQFVQVQNWWSEDHTYWGKAENLSLEPRAGGCFCEKEGDKSVQHMQVSFVAPGKEIRLLGGLGPLQGLGLQGALTFKFIPVSDNETSIVQIYRVSGFYPEGMEKLAIIVDQVQTLQMKNLQGRFTPGL